MKPLPFFLGDPEAEKEVVDWDEEDTRDGEGGVRAELAGEEADAAEDEEKNDANAGWCLAEEDAVAREAEDEAREGDETEGKDDDEDEDEEEEEDKSKGL